MAPHVEEYTGCCTDTDGQQTSIYREVPGTRHETGDTRSFAARLAHRLAKFFPHNKKEVDDNLGAVCPWYDQDHLLAELKKREA